MVIEDKLDTNLQLKRPKLNSTSSDPGVGPDSDVETKAKRLKLEQIDEVNNESSSPKTSELNRTTE
jgi:hypothetical protein